MTPIEQIERNNRLAGGLISWREMTWGERGCMLLVWILATIFGAALFVAGIYLIGSSVEGLERYNSEHRTCLQHATNGLEIEQCR